MIPEAKHRATLHMVLSGPHSGLQNFVPRSGQNRKINSPTQMKQFSYVFLNLEATFAITNRAVGARKNISFGGVGAKNLDLFT